MAVQDVSENPSANAVTRPTVIKTRDEDIERKLRLYGIFQAFSNGVSCRSDGGLTERIGKFPSNKQISRALTSAIDSQTLKTPSNQLSGEGRQLVQDLRDVIDSMQHLWLTKNYDENLQKFLYHTIQASTAPDGSNINAPVSKDQIQQHGEDHLHGLRTLGRLLVTNGQFRKLLEDSTLLIRDMIADGATKATQRIRPDQDRLKRIDEPAPDHTWHEAPPSLDDLKTKWKDAPGQADGRQNQAREAYQGNKQQAKDYVRNKIPQERRDKAIFRLKKMVVEIQQHEDYAEAIDTLVSLAEEYVHHAKSVAKDTHREVRRTAQDSNIQKAQLELKILLENFADGASMDDMFDAANDLITDAGNDPEFDNWGKQLDRFVRKCLKEDGYILNDQSTAQWNQIIDQGQYFLNDRYKDHTDRLTDEVKQWLDYMTNDPESVAFGQKVQKLFTDLGQDKDGNVTFKPHLLKDVTDVIIPAFFDNLGYIPVHYHAD